MSKEQSVKTLRLGCLLSGLIVTTVAWAADSQSVDSRARDAGHAPRLAITCVISKDVKRLVEFYEPVLMVKATWSGADYAEFRTGDAVLAV
jgi:hypothetical protein